MGLVSLRHHTQTLLKLWKEMRPPLMATPKWKHHAKDLKFTIIKGSQKLVDIETCKIDNSMSMNKHMIKYIRSAVKEWRKEEPMENTIPGQG
jgi:hypothetical protein